MDAKLMFFCCGAVLIVLIQGWIPASWAMEMQQSTRTWSASAELGTTVDGSCTGRLVGSWWLPETLKIGKGGIGSARLELDLGVLDSRDTTFDAGIQPVLRYSRTSDITPYLDLGAGIHFLSRSNIRGRQMGASFQFSVLAGTGISFHDKWEIGYRFLHISNADIHDNNDGRDEHLAVITFVF